MASSFPTGWKQGRMVGKRYRYVRIGALGLGVVLLGLAIGFAWREQDAVAAALKAIREQSTERATGLLFVLAGSVLANLVLTGVVFRLLISRYGRVGLMEMQALIAASTLLNYVPLRPGMLSRVAYHKVINRIAVGSSVKTMIQAAVLSAIVALYLVLVLGVSGDRMIVLWILALLPIPLLVIGGVVIAGLRVWLWAAAARTLEVFVIAVRYTAAFALIGRPISPSAALAFACLSMMVMLIPFLSNGLGLREWAVGIMAPILTPYQLELGLTADLLTRAAEILVIVGAGLCAAAYLTKRITHTGSNRATG